MINNVPKNKKEEQDKLKQQMEEFENKNGKVETSPIQKRTKVEDINAASKNLRKYVK